MSVWAPHSRIWARARPGPARLGPGGPPGCLRGRPVPDSGRYAVLRKSRKHGPERRNFWLRACLRTQKIPELRPWRVPAGLWGLLGGCGAGLGRRDGQLDRAGGISAERHIRVVLKMKVKCPKIMPFTDVACTRAGSYRSLATPGAMVAARGFGGGHGDVLGDMCKSRAC